MREAVEEFDDSTTLVFYLYKGQYAAIDIIPENDVSFEVQFLGGDTRMQNMILLADDEKVVEVQGSNEGSVETITMIAEENDTVKFTYDSDSGDITMEAKYDEESYNFAGNLAVDKNSMVITIDDLGSASEDVSGSITWKKGAQFEEVSGDTFDLGNATEEEWQDLLHEIFAKNVRWILIHEIFFFDICHLRVKKPDSGEKKHGKVYSDVITDRRRSACGQSRYEGCRCVPDGGDWRCDP